MKVRMKHNIKTTGTASKFNTGSPAGEVVMYFDDYEKFGGADSVYISDLEVFITKNIQFLLNKEETQKWTPVGHWISMGEAFKNHDLITDNYNTEFFEPKNEEEKKRGYRM